MIGKFIGQRIIKSVDIFSDDAVIANFEDGSHEIVSNILLEATVSDGSRDETSLREDRVCATVEAVLELFKKYNIKLSELEHIFMTTKMSLENSVSMANEALWGVEQKTMLDVDRVLKSKKVALDDIVGNNVDK